MHAIKFSHTTLIREAENGDQRPETGEREGGKRMSPTPSPSSSDGYKYSTSYFARNKLI